MHDGSEQNILTLVAVNDTKRKPMHQTSPDLSINRGPRKRVSHDVVDCRHYFVIEVRAESRLARFIVCNGLKKFSLRIRMKLVFHRRGKRARSSAKTSSPGIGSTAPDLTSSRRCRDTAIHCASISGTGVLSERSNESTSRSRSSTGSILASSIMSVVLIVSNLSGAYIDCNRHRAKFRQNSYFGA